MEIKGLKKNMFRECLRVFHEPVILGVFILGRLAPEKKEVKINEKKSEK